MRTALVVIHDLAAAALAWSLAFWLRFNFDVPAAYQQVLLTSLMGVLPLQAVIAWGWGLYRGMWRFASLPDLKRIILAGGSGALAAPMLLYMLQRLAEVPRSVLVLYPLLLILFMSGSRFLYRSWKDGHLLSFRAVAGEPVLVLGAGDAAIALLRELERSTQWHVVGLLDDDESKRQRLINGVPVLGPVASVGEQARRHAVTQVIMAMPGEAHAVRHQAAKLASAAGLTVLTVPSIDDLLSGRIAISQMRKVQLEDLLGRDKVTLDDENLHRLIAGKVVLVTGAGGSIGAELCRQIARFTPRRLVFYELSEFALYNIEQEFARLRTQLAVTCIVGDVKDAARLREVFGAFQPQLVFHAAAYKHVPLMEGENAWEAVRNNVLGTWRVAQAAIEAGAEKFVLISTDKAVNPTNVMGASKRLAERVSQAMGSSATGTRMITVRFGNVLGSSGSVIPKFREQIAAGGPLTVTHPEVVRYFMLIPEAAQLVLQAAVMGRGGEIFVLDMGEPVKIVDLAREMIRYSGFSEEDIGIEFIGLRPGEKLYEELLAYNESTQPTPHAKLRVARADAVPDARWLEDLARWLDAGSLDSAVVKRELASRVPEYRPAPGTEVG